MKNYNRRTLIAVAVAILLILPIIAIAQAGVNHDTNGDRCISRADFDAVEDYYNMHGGAGDVAGHANLDVNSDGQVTALDGLLIVNCLNNNNCSARKCSLGVSRSLEPSIPEDQFNPPPAPSCVSDCDPTTPECDVADCAGTCKGTAVDRGCGCGNPAAGECGCDLSIVRDCAGNCGGTAVDSGCGCGSPAPNECNRCDGQGKDSCNLCPSETGYNQSRPADECCPGVTKDCAGVCGGGDISCQNQCLLYEIRVREVKQDSGPGVPENRWNLTNNKPTCLADLSNALIDACSSARYIDDCEAAYFTRESLWEWEDYLPSVDSAFGIPSGNIYRNEQGGMEADVYYDANCRPVTTPVDPTKICDAGELHYRYSPISLIWEGQNSGSLPFTVSSFQLDPRRRNYSFIWKASSTTPLLVYDPEHKGKIESAQQLFGNWTFGGKKSASLNPELSLSDVRKIAWEDGYEALGTLDNDMSGEIEGKELEPLALWFDENQDGISDEGEVVAATKIGIVSLKYNGGVKDPSTSDIILTNGFTRQLDSGEKKVGHTVDWYAEGAESAQELVTKYVGRTHICEDNIEHQEFPGEKENNSVIFAKATDVIKSPLDGHWKWHVLPEKGEFKPGMAEGLFTFEIGKGGIVNGHVYQETNFVKEFYNARSMIAVRLLEGKIETDKDSNILVSFSIKSSRAGSVNNIAQIAKGSNQMFGESVAIVPIDGKTQTLKYKWVAKKE